MKITGVFIRINVPYIKLRASKDQLSQLTLPVSNKEVLAVLKAFHRKRTSPGLDGIPYGYYIEHQEILVPILVKLANTMMDTGRLPYSMEKVLIKVLPKAGKDPLYVSNYRPIALLNTNLKIISSVINNRLLPVASDMIGTSQVGFLPNRKMDSLILDMMTITNHYNSKYSPLVFNKSQVVKKEMRANESAKRDIMISVDYQKAFDSVSHGYIEKVLKKIGMPDGMVKILMAITTQQIGYLFINNQVGEAIQLKSGVRQGNPASPTIFVMVLEPLLSQIRKNLNGISLNSFFNRHTITTLAYADDIVVLISGAADAKKFQRLIKGFSTASGLVLNDSKTKVFLLSPKSNWNNNNFDKVYGKLLPYDHIHISDTDDVYLGIPYNGVDWKALGEKLAHNIRFPLIQNLPLRVRSISIGIYVLSKIYFRDVFFPIPDATMTQVKKEIDKQMHGVAYERLVIPARYGGFSLQDIPLQVLGKRAKMIYLLFFDTEMASFAILREKLQFLALEITLLLNLNQYNQFESCLSSLHSGSNYIIHTFSWFNFLDGKFINYINSYKDEAYSPINKIFTIPQSSITLTEFFSTILPHAAFNPKRYLQFMDVKTSKFFTPTQLSWFAAWEEVTYSPSVSTDLDFVSKKRSEIYHYCHKDLTAAQRSLKLNIRDIEGEIPTLESFKHFNKKLKKAQHQVQSRFPAYAPRLQDNEAGREQWETFWYKHYKHQITAPGSLEPLQLFNLGLFDHKYHFNSSTTPDEAPRLRLPFCSLCQQEDQPETVVHLFQDCIISKALWHLATTFTHQNTIEELVAPWDGDKTKMLQLSNYIGLIWYLRTKRRRTLSPPTTDLAKIEQEAARYLKLKRSPIHYYDDVS